MFNGLLSYRRTPRINCYTTGIFVCCLCRTQSFLKDYDEGDKDEK